MTYTGQLSIIVDQAKATLSDLVREHGTESKFRNDLVLNCNIIPKDYSLDNGRYLQEISVNELIDNQGYGYSASVLDIEDFFAIVDFYVNFYKKLKQK